MILNGRDLSLGVLRRRSRQLSASPDITDIFNLLQNSPTYSGGALTVADYQGVLRTSPANTAGFEGGRLDGGVWYDTEADGVTPIQAFTTINTLAGARKWYTEPFSGPFGYSNWPARTNKVTARKFNPVDTTNITKGGDAAAVLSVVDDTAALTAAGLIGICTGGKVYKLDNSVGTAVSFANIGGTAGNTNVHLFMAFVRGGTGRIMDGNWYPNGGSAFLADTAYRLVSHTGSAFNSSSTLLIKADIGQIVYFILPQLEEGAFATPPIFNPASDALTRITRAATVLRAPFTLGPQVQLKITPAATANTCVLLDDGTNKLSYNGTNLIFTNGTTTMSAAATLTAGTTYTIGLKGLAGDWALSVNGVDIDTDTGALVTWAQADVRMGCDVAGINQFAGYVPNAAGYSGPNANWYKTEVA